MVAEKLESQIEKIIESSKINNFIEKCLNTVQNQDDLVNFFRNFTLYNQEFPGGIATLAGSFHVRGDLFRDNSAELNDNSDRSSLIASNIFFAAEDEFALKKRKIRVTHRTLAQQVLQEVINFSGWSNERFNATFANNSEYKSKALTLRNGYRINSIVDERDLFLALGFHLGSERLADIEFTFLHKMLCSNFPDFVSLTKKVKGEGGVSVYSWVNVHTVVEIDHYEFSLVAAEQASNYYVGNMLSKNDIRDLLITGFNEFVDFQRSMFDYLK